MIILMEDESKASLSAKVPTMSILPSNPLSIHREREREREREIKNVISHLVPDSMGLDHTT